MPAPLWTGLVSKVASKRTRITNFYVLSGTLFRVFRQFLTVDFSFIFEVTSDSELCALWCRKVAHKKVFGNLFGWISRSVAKVRMKLPCRRQHRFRGFRAPKKRQISPLFPEGVRGSSGMAFFIDFGCPPGSEKEATLELASAFFAVQNFHDF